MIAVVAALVANCGGDSEPKGTAAPRVSVDSISVSAQDRAAIEALGNYLRDAQAAGPDEALNASVAANYGVSRGLYKPERCADHLRRALGGIFVAYRWSPRFDLDSLRPLTQREVRQGPQQVFGAVEGRVYSLRVDVAVSDRTTNVDVASTTITMTVVVVEEGTAKSLARCGPRPRAAKP